MKLCNTNWVRLMVAICFAVLQALQPFIHAHVDADHPIQHTGLHVGSEHEEAHSFEHMADHALSNVAHVSHTVSVDSSIKQDADSLFLVHAFLLVFTFCLVLALASPQKFNRAFLLKPKQSFKRRLPASRAPPHC